ncbi:MAG: class I SAM-dependent methyltransferase [Actinobacteria bacterium]|nr:class I SAM-dependent methyltransferase [Actinomycetota bacterium]
MSFASRALAFASQRFPKASSRVLASAGYTFDLDTFGPNAFRVWNSRTAARQDRAWAPLVARAIAGNPREDIVALYDALDSTGVTAGTILEVGCGGGYNSELIAHHTPGLRYTGIDLSESMVEVSRAKYPDRDFRVASALDLPFDDGAFDVVIDGVALLHIPPWREAIAEYRRVASRFVVLHGLTLSDHETVAFGKYAYGQPSREFILNRADVVAACEALGLRLVASLPGDDYDLTEYLGVPTVSETWVLAV